MSRHYSTRSFFRQVLNASLAFQDGALAFDYQQGRGWTTCYVGNVLQHVGAPSTMLKMALLSRGLGRLLGAPKGRRHGHGRPAPRLTRSHACQVLSGRWYKLFQVAGTLAFLNIQPAHQQAPISGFLRFAPPSHGSVAGA